MATAVAKVKQQYVVKDVPRTVVEEKQTGVTLELNMAEARLIRAMVGHISYEAEGYCSLAGKACTDIFDALNAVGVVGRGFAPSPFPDGGSATFRVGLSKWLEEGK